MIISALNAEYYVNFGSVALSMTGYGSFIISM